MQISEQRGGRICGQHAQPGIPRLRKPSADDNNHVRRSENSVQGEDCDGMGYLGKKLGLWCLNGEVVPRTCLQLGAETGDGERGGKAEGQG